jgi:hypothetical protein
VFDLASAGCFFILKEDFQSRAYGRHEHGT